jgi:hypothetical protein
MPLFLYKYLCHSFNKSVFNWTFCHSILHSKKSPIAWKKYQSVRPSDGMSACPSVRQPACPSMCPSVVTSVCVYVCIFYSFNHAIIQSLFQKLLFWFFKICARKIKLRLWHHHAQWRWISHVSRQFRNRSKTGFRRTGPSGDPLKPVYPQTCSCSSSCCHVGVGGRQVSQFSNLTWKNNFAKAF